MLDGPRSRCRGVDRRYTQVCETCSTALRLIAAGVLLLAIIETRTADAQFRDAGAEFGFSGGGTAAFADYDADGWIDLYAGRLYHNEGGERFVPVEDSGVPSGEGIWGDYDNDGRVDLFLFTGKGTLLKNTSDGKFESVPFPELPTVNSRGAVWLDLNADGWLDLYVGGYEIWQKTVHPDAAFLNQRDGTFRESWRSPAEGCHSARGVTTLDYDEDGRLDVYVSNYRLQPNFLLKSDGRGKLRDVAVEVGAAGVPDGGEIAYTGGIRYRICGHTIGSAAGDLDDDGHIDIFVGNFSHPRPGQDRPQFLRNRGPDGNFAFEDRSANAGLDWQESFASAALGDYDNDGDLDLFFTTVYAVGSGGVKNFPVLYRNEGNWTFINRTKEEGLSNLGPTYQAAWADIDNDGDLDLCTAGKLFVNETPQRNWISLALEGDGDLVNRSAVGAVARIRLGDRLLTRQVETGTGEGNQNARRLHFGLGDRSEPVSFEIVWPGKLLQQVGPLAANQNHRVQFLRPKDR